MIPRHFPVDSAIVLVIIILLIYVTIIIFVLQRPKNMVGFGFDWYIVLIRWWRRLAFIHYVKQQEKVLFYFTNDYIDF